MLEGYRAIGKYVAEIIIYFEFDEYFVFLIVTLLDNSY
jgi:hypothetical protein